MNSVFLPLMLRNIRVACCAILVGGVVGCSTDVELNAPYDSKTIVFGLLEADADTQWVKINRTWLGEGNNLDYAAIRDSSEYQEGEFVGTINEIVNGGVVNSFTIQDTLLDNKDEDGIFFAPQHTAYYIATPSGLNNEADYSIELDFTNKDDVSSSTNMINTVPGAITFPPQGNPEFQMSWANVTGVANVVYFDPIFKWTSSANASRYEAALTVYIVENVWNDLAHTDLVSSTPRQLEWFLGSETATGQQGQTINMKVEGRGFYSFLNSRLTADPFVTREIGIWDEEEQFVRAFDFTLTIANDELATYLAINEPVTNIVQERPEYTNINNGLGLWASRSEEKAVGIGFTTGTMRALQQSDLTQGLNFCSPNPFDDELGCQ